MGFVRRALVGSAAVWLARKALDKKRDRERTAKRLDRHSGAPAH
jgi:hypothetical protein